jgi:mannose-6-phosphate isomerase class I
LKLIRKTSQHLLPQIKPDYHGGYDIYPSYNIGDNRIFSGFRPLAEAISGKKTVLIDGFSGVLWEEFQQRLHAELKKLGKEPAWISTFSLLNPPEKIYELVKPFLGGTDPLFGKRADLNIEDFFEEGSFDKLKARTSSGMLIVIGPGAALAKCGGLVVYADIPKNEIQFRSRAGSISCLGASGPEDPKMMYKRFYFVDWPVLGRHKEKIITDIDIYADTQDLENPAWMYGAELRKSVHALSRNLFRVRPWFEPGAWGGTWIKEHISGLNKDVPNYAWSFELIAPENGLLLESSGRLLEASFDMLMYIEAEAVLGDCSGRFGVQFPLRFDFLDTFDGGNLSIQCHPRPGYTKEHFGEDFTQEETYYILDTKDDARVYLGFTENIDKDEFRSSLEKSFSNNTRLEVEKFVVEHAVKKHDLLLIPYGTVHGSGKNNLVLEISSTPYIFTFKLYDWLRPDLDGKPRPLNIERAMENLYFERKGKYVTEMLISRPEKIGEGPGWELWHLPTHETHFYDVHRYVIKDSATVINENKCHVLSLVEGSSITVETKNGMKQVFNYAETFVIPAAAERYTITNNSEKPVIVVKAFVK